MQQSNDNAIRAIPPVICVFQVGDTFTSQDGVKVHVMGERYTAKGRELLYCAHGVKMWDRETRFWRAV